MNFANSLDAGSAVEHVRQGKNVVVTRTFSKIWGMAGMRAGFACAREAIIRRMAPFRNNVISIVTARGVLAALAHKDAILAERVARFGKVRDELTAWLRAKKVKFIEPHANFVMIETGREVRSLAGAMAAKGVVVGRAFPPLETMMRVTIGSASDMDKFRRTFWEVYSG